MQKHPKAWENELVNYMKRAYQRGHGVSKSAARKEKHGGKHMIHNDNTYNNYTSAIRQFARFIYEQGVTDVLKIKPQHSEAFMRQEIGKGNAAHTLSVKKEAIEKLANSVAFEKGRKSVHMINQEKVREAMNAAGKIRHADPTHEDRHKGAIISKQEAEKIIEALRSSRSPNAEVAAKLAEFQMMTGGRVSASYRFHVSDFNREKSSVRFNDDKGGKSRENREEKEKIDKIAGWAEGKKAGSLLLEFRDRRGNIMSIEKARESYSRLIQNARIKAGLDREKGAQITSHSFRKVYANELADKLRSEPLERIIQGAKMLSSDRNFRERLNKETGGKITEANRWKAEQMIISHALGHSRRDVLTFYLSDDGE